MKLYHGSKDIVGKPIYGKGKINNDYGRGFYCTEVKELAKEWAVSLDRDGYVNTYNIDISQFKILNINNDKFCMLHWLTILLNNREFSLTTPLEREAKRYLSEVFAIKAEDNFGVGLEEADIIRGYRADDSYFSYAKDFISGYISYEQLCKAMKLGNLGEQICIKSKRAFLSMEFIDAEKVYAGEWYARKMLRENNARNGYRSMEKERYRRGELYISKIIDEEMMPDDIRLR